MNRVSKWIIALFLCLLASQFYITKGSAATSVTIENLQVDQNPVNLDNNITVKVKLSGVANNVQVSYIQKMTGSGLPGSVTYSYDLGMTDENGEVTHTFTVPNEWGTGTWNVSQITINTNDGTQVIKNSELSTDIDAVDLSSGDIHIATTPKLMFKYAAIDKNHVTTGDLINFTIRAEDGLGSYLLNDSIVYRTPSGSEFTVPFIRPLFKTYPLNYEEGASLQIGLTTEPGLWQVDRIIIDDPDFPGTTLTIYNSAFYDGGIDLSNLNLQIDRVKGWLSFNGSRYYLDPVTGQPKTGLFNDNGKAYYFHDDGKMAAGEWIAINGVTYYFTNANEPEIGIDYGSMIKNGWTYIENPTGQYNRYYFLSDGTHFSNSWKQINQKWFYFDSNGINPIGWFTYNGQKYYGGVTDGRVVGLQQITGNWYYFNKDGTLNSQFKEGWNTGEGNKYYLLNGKFVTGWKQILGKWYYFNSNDVMAVNSWIKTGNTWYYLKGDGTKEQSAWLYYQKAWYYFDSTGAMKTGWVLAGNTRYYLNPNGTMVTGWKKIGNKWYYFSSSGKMVTGWQTISGKRYYFNSNGIWSK